MDADEMGNTENEPNEVHKPVEPERKTDAEQLLKIVEFQLAQQRKERHAGDPRTAFRIWSLVVIVVGMILALLVLQWMLTQLPRPERARQNPTSVPTEQPAGR